MADTSARRTLRRLKRHVCLAESWIGTVCNLDAGHEGEHRNIHPSGGARIFPREHVMRGSKKVCTDKKCKCCRKRGGADG